MADLNSSKVYGSLTVAHDSIINRDLTVDGATDLLGILTANNPSNVLAGSLSGNASTATKLETARSIGISLSGDATASGSISFDGSGNVTITASNVVVANDSHTHAWTNITSRPGSIVVQNLAGTTLATLQLY